MPQINATPGLPGNLQLALNQLRELLTQKNCFAVSVDIYNQDKTIVPVTLTVYFNAVRLNEPVQQACEQPSIKEYMGFKEPGLTGISAW